MYIFEYQDKEFIDLNSLLKILAFPLEHFVHHIIDDLCFVYHGIVSYSTGEDRFYRGLVYPDVKMLYYSHIQAAVRQFEHYKFVTDTTNTTQTALNMLSNTGRRKYPDYQQAFLDAGQASSSPLGDTPTFYLKEYVLPYYVVSVDCVRELGSKLGFLLPDDVFISLTRQPMSLAWKNTDRKPKNTLQLDGDILKNSILMQQAKIKELEDALEKTTQEKEKLNQQLLDNLASVLGANFKTSQLQKQITELQQQAESLTNQTNDIVKSPMQKKATAKLIGSLILKAFPMYTKEKGLNTHGLIGLVQAEAGVSQAVAKAWIELAIEELS